MIFNKCVIADRPDGSGDICLSLSVLNISDRKIETLYFDLKGLDVLNEEKCNIKDIYSLDMCIKPGEEFSLPEDILLPEKTIRRIRITLRHVCFTDESIWNYDGLITSEGKSFSEPIYYEDGSVNMDASRRVEFKAILLY